MRLAWSDLQAAEKPGGWLRRLATLLPAPAVPKCLAVSQRGYFDAESRLPMFAYRLLLW